MSFRGGWSFAWGDSGGQSVLTASGIPGMHRWSVDSWDLTHEVNRLVIEVFIHGCLNCHELSHEIARGS